VRVFAERFGARPRWGASAPGRVNLIGEHTDYNGGFVLPMAIDRRCVAVAGPAQDAGVSRVFSVELGEEWGMDVRGRVEVGMRCADGRELARGTAISYAAGVFAGFAGRGAQLANLDVVIASDVPIGGGLSSSAAMEVSVATLLEQAAGTRLSAMEKVLLCQRAEHEFAGVPCGIMDQVAAVMGRAGHALLIDCREGSVEEVAMPPREQAVVLVVNTSVRHALADGEYGRRRAACAAAAVKLGVGSLREVTEGMFAVGDLSEEELRCARHVVRENARVLAAAAALRDGDLRRLGELMVESHESLQDDYRVSCAELDEVVESARGCAGVLGARMTGAGFGGCAVVLVEKGAVGGVAAAIQCAYSARFARSCAAEVVSAGAGAKMAAV
jgi:galactokinase